MSLIALLVAIIALIVACLAYQRSGGTIEEMKEKVDDLGISLEGLKAKTADMLNACERKLRGEDKPPEGPSDPPRDDAAC